MTVIGVPYHLDEHLPDLDFTPEPAELITPELPEGDIWSRLAVLYAAVADAVTRSHADGGPPVVVASGDCLTALGTVAGLQAAGTEPGIVWFDAHGDVQTPETTSSGYLAGMALRLLTDYRPELIASRLRLRPVPENRIVLVDARDLDPPEVTYLDQSQIRRRKVTDLAVSDLPDAPLYVHLDLDVIDGAQLPGLRYPTPAGRTPDRWRMRSVCCWAPATWPRSASPVPGFPATGPLDSSPPTSRSPSPAPDPPRRPGVDD